MFITKSVGNVNFNSPESGQTFFYTIIQTSGGKNIILKKSSRNRFREAKKIGEYTHAYKFVCTQFFILKLLFSNPAGSFRIFTNV